MSELNIKMVPLSAIDYAINEASEGWNQFLDTEEMKVVAIPEDPEEMVLCQDLVQVKMRNFSPF